MQSPRSCLFLLVAVLSACDDDVGSTDPGADAGGNACPAVKTTEEAVRVYGSAWNEHDPVKRACLLERSVAPDIIYIDPTIDTASRADLSTAIEKFQTSAPQASIAQLSGLDVRSGELRFGWDFRVGEQSAVKGLDYIELAADGRLASIRGYWEPMPVTPPTGALADYVAAWTASDETTRNAKLDSSVSDTVRYTADGEDRRGRAALGAFMASLGAAKIEVLGTQVYPKFARIALELTVPGTGAPTRTTDYVYLGADGKLTRIARFDGDLPAL